jgi:hypothetical protein
MVSPQAIPSQAKNAQNNAGPSPTPTSQATRAALFFACFYWLLRTAVSKIRTTRREQEPTTTESRAYRTMPYGFSPAPRLRGAFLRPPLTLHLFSTNLILTLQLFLQPTKVHDSTRINSFVLRRSMTPSAGLTTTRDSSGPPWIIWPKPETAELRGGSFTWRWPTSSLETGSRPRPSYRPP